jgi:hypothetical protein
MRFSPYFQDYPSPFPLSKTSCSRADLHARVTLVVVLSALRKAVFFQVCGLCGLPSTGGDCEKCSSTVILLEGAAGVIVPPTVRAAGAAAISRLHARVERQPREGAPNLSACQ